MLKGLDELDGLLDRLGGSGGPIGDRHGRPTVATQGLPGQTVDLAFGDEEPLPAWLPSPLGPELHLLGVAFDEELLGFRADLLGHHVASGVAVFSHLDVAAVPGSDAVAVGTADGSGDVALGKIHRLDLKEVLWAVDDLLLHLRVLVAREVGTAGETVGMAIVIDSACVTTGAGGAGVVPQAGGAFGHEGSFEKSIWT